MTETNNKLRRLLGLAVKAFILASVVADILPLPQYAHSLGDEDYIVYRKYHRFPVTFDYLNIVRHERTLL